MSNSPLSFSALKRNRGSVEKLTSAINQAQSGKKEDQRFWEPAVDKAGNGSAVIRFLDAPPQDGEDGLPWIQKFTHGFQGPGGWYIEECPTTVGAKCPACERNNTLWNSGIEANKKVARDRKRRLSYIANILVIADPAHPENEGKVKLFKFGKKIFDKIFEKMSPDPAFPDEKAWKPCCLWEGAPFKLKIRNVDGYRNYDKSEFGAQAPVADTDEKLEAIWKQEHSLREFVDPKIYKTYAQLDTRISKVLGTAVSAPASAEKESLTEQEVPEQVSPVRQSVAQPSVDDSEDEDLSYFKSLANQE